MKTRVTRLSPASGRPRSCPTRDAVTSWALAQENSIGNLKTMITHGHIHWPCFKLSKTSLYFTTQSICLEFKLFVLYNNICRILGSGERIKSWMLNSLIDFPCLASFGRTRGRKGPAKWSQRPQWSITASGKIKLKKNGHLVMLPEWHRLNWLRFV